MTELKFKIGKEELKAVLDADTNKEIKILKN